MEPVGQASKACNACRRSALETGWALPKDVSAASPKTAGAIWRQASQSMHVESTKKSPATFSGTRFLGFAMTEPPTTFYACGRPRIFVTRLANTQDGGAANRSDQRAAFHDGPTIAAPAVSSWQRDEGAGRADPVRLRSAPAVP